MRSFETPYRYGDEVRRRTPPYTVALLCRKETMRERLETIQEWFRTHNPLLVMVDLPD